jgi:protein-S-isoprenylcysteine O-methyltransferase Ste14
MMTRLLVFFILLAGIAFCSRSFLRNPHSHGFYRFFAFGSLLLLVTLNAEYWFWNPFSLLQIFSWLALVGSAGLAIQGFYLLRAVGKPVGNLEATTRLVRCGAYRYIRHPLYASLLYLGLGVMLKNVTLVSLSLFVGLLAFLIATARAEEQESIAHFGADYLDYMKKTRMFVPYLF